MNYIFIFLILISILCAIINGTMGEVMDAILKSSQKAVEISLSLIGIMAFWLGIVNIAKTSGLMEKFSKIIKKPLLKIFPDLKDNENAIGNISINPIWHKSNGGYARKKPKQTRSDKFNVHIFGN